MNIEKYQYVALCVIYKKTFAQQSRVNIFKYLVIFFLALFAIEKYKYNNNTLRSFASYITIFISYITIYEVGHNVQL